MALINKLEAIADAIRDKTNTYDALTLDEMATAIRGISGREPVIESLTVTKNGEYEAEGVDGFNPVIVNVESRQPVVEELSITANGTYTPPEGVDGYSSIVVEVPVDLTGVPEELIHYSGSCVNQFAGSAWSWVVDKYGDQITTSDITEASSMFSGSAMERIPFDINLKGDVNVEKMFYNTKLKEVPYVKGSIQYLSSMFNYSYYIREFPEDWTDYIDLTTFKNMQTSSPTGQASHLFNGCYSLRKLPKNFINQIYNTFWGTQSLYYQPFYNCYALDEVRDLAVFNLYMYTSNMFTYTFNNCYRLKDMTFNTQEDGTPFVAQWKSQTIDLSAYVGYGGTYSTHYKGYNSGITSEKRVGNADTYAALKDDPDWYTNDPKYSRYNHDSAVATINSLPDTSAYLAAKGGTNTIKFLGNSGAYTDEGAINTLTTEEIAVATAKGWTVSFT